MLAQISLKIEAAFNLTNDDNMLFDIENVEIEKLNIIFLMWKRQIGRTDRSKTNLIKYGFVRFDAVARPAAAVQWVVGLIPT